MGFFSNLLGGKREEKAVPKIQEQEAASEVPETPANTEAAICTNCGAINTGGEVSCKDCGTPL